MPLKKILHAQPFETPELNIGEVVGSKTLIEGINIAIPAYNRFKSDRPDADDC